MSKKLLGVHEVPKGAELHLTTADETAAPGTYKFVLADAAGKIVKLEGDGTKKFIKGGDLEDDTIGDDQLAPSGVSAGQYGSATEVGQFTVDVNGRITSASDVQIDHDQLLNFVANEHIDHSSVSVLAGTGLAGGGNIAASRTLSIADIVGLTAASYGAADKSLTITVNQQGQVTSAAEQAISITHDQVSDFDAGVRENSIDQLADAAADVSMGDNKITDLADGVANSDAVNKGQLDSAIDALDLDLTDSAGNQAAIDLSSEELQIDGTPSEVEVQLNTVNKKFVVGLPDSVSVTQNLTVGGNLTVNGTQHEIQGDIVKYADTLLEVGVPEDGSGGTVEYASWSPSASQTKDLGLVGWRVETGNAGASQEFLFDGDDIDPDQGGNIQPQFGSASVQFTTDFGTGGTLDPDGHIEFTDINGNVATYEIAGNVVKVVPGLVQIENPTFDPGFDLNLDFATSTFLDFGTAKYITPGGASYDKKKLAMFWDESASSFKMAKEVVENSGVLTTTTLGDLHIADLDASAITAASLQTSGNVVAAGNMAADDLTLAGKLKMPDNGAAKILIGDGTSYEEQAVTGDISLTAAGVAAISAGVIDNADISASAAIDMDKLDGGSLDSSLTQVDQADLMYVGDSDDSSNLKSVTFSDMEDQMYANMNAASSDVSVAAGGAISLSDDSVGSAEIEENAVGSSELDADAVGLDHLAPGTKNGQILGYNHDNQTWVYARPCMFIEFGAAFDTAGAATLNSTPEALDNSAIVSDQGNGLMRVDLPKLFEMPYNMMRDQFLAQVFLYDGSSTSELVGTGLTIVDDGSTIYAQFDLDGATFASGGANSTVQKIRVGFKMCASDLKA